MNRNRLNAHLTTLVIASVLALTAAVPAIDLAEAAGPLLQYKCCWCKGTGEYIEAASSVAAMDQTLAACTLKCQQETGVPAILAYIDQDGDGFKNEQCGGTDCNDQDADTNPGAAEDAQDPRDLNCNGTPQCGTLTFSDDSTPGNVIANCAMYTLPLGLLAGLLVSYRPQVQDTLTAVSPS